MTDSIEASAKTVNEAIALALQRLGKTQDEVEVEVITEGSRGILGIGAEDARVRVSVRKPEPVAMPTVREPTDVAVYHPLFSPWRRK